MPEAPSPRMITTTRDITTADSIDYPPSRYEDLKREEVTSVTAFVQPREVPLPGQSQISGPVGGQLFPPMRTSNDIPRSASVRPTQKKSVFETGNGPARSITVGKLAISNPILAEGGSNPLDKVATTDLATAAQMDRERREQIRLMNSKNNNLGPMMEEGEATMSSSTTLIARDMTMSATEPSLPESATLAVGMASGWQLSPSGQGDELRRRSPRRMASNASEKSSTTQSSQSTQSSDTSYLSSQAPTLPEKSPARLVPRPLQPLSAGGVNQAIRPSRQLAPTPEPVIEPLKTPLQRMPPGGLPLNPRARSLKKKAEEMEPLRNETVMFVNSIVYDDPDFVESVLDNFKSQAPKTAPLMPTSKSASIDSSSIPTTPGTATSVVNRPRPIPRKPAEDDQSFYPPTNSGHRKSRSAGSVLRSVPGSPTTLPPLPPPPMKPSAYRPQPNDTKSMTFDEKVKYLFPPSRENSKSKRRSSNPELPISFMSDSPTLTDGESESYNNSRDSKRTQSSVRTRSIFDDQDGVSAMPREVSIGNYQGLIDEEEELLDEHAMGEGTLMSRNTGGKRASSPILPMMGDFRSSSTSGVYDDDSTTNMESIHSPLPIQQIGMTVMQARAVEVGRSNDNLRIPQPTRGVSTVTAGEEMTFMIDSAVARDVQQEETMSPFSVADKKSTLGDRASTISFGPTQTHHIGDETPSFSILSEKRSSRRGPPPTPLVLSERPTSAKQATLAKAAELSPLPSPDEALKMIQAQLKKYEEPNEGGSFESPGRLALLNDLEMEMGMQETRWMGMQNAFSRDSFSTVDESRHASAVLGGYNSDHSLSRNSSLRSNNLGEGLENSRRSRLGSVGSMFSTRLSNAEPGTRATLWQKRLEEAQLEYMENANEMIRKRSVNFLTAPKSGGGLTPAPPDSQESEAEIESRKNFAAFLAAKTRSDRSASISGGLWVPPPAPENRDGLMWVRPERPYHVYIVEPPLPGLSVRVAPRKEASPLPIESSQLWQKPAGKPANESGLWKSAVELKALRNKSKRPSFYKPEIQRSRSNPTPSSTSSRPLTQRPPRRSKRITALPDIIEDPQPLPNKRDTLGIFQFPWGEKSDKAFVPQPGPASRPFAAIAGTMSTGGSSVRVGLEARSQQLEAAEYSSSFFDDYEDDASDNSSDMGSDDDEGFDESTLFEIASLLKSTNVPSTQSFFGPSSSRDVTDDFLDDYMDDEDRYEEARRDDRQTILVGMEEEFEALQEMRPRETIPSTLWEIEEEDEEEGKGLPQPENWEDAYDQVSETARAKPRLSLQPPTIASDSLWSGSTPNIQSARSPLWTPLASPKPASTKSPSTTTRPSSVEQASSAESSPKGDVSSPSGSASSPPLWTPTEQGVVGDHSVGLPHPADWESYNTAKATARAKPRQSVPAVIESDNMWQVPTASNNEMSWLSPKASPKASSKEVSLKDAIMVTVTETVIVEQSVPLWEETEKRSPGDHGVGLPHPADWAEYDNVKSTSRAKPRQAEPAVIESSNMWQAPAVSTEEMSWLSPKTSPKASPKVEAAPITVITDNVALWEESEKRSPGDHGVGLPHPMDWVNYDNVQATARAKPRQQVEPAVIESADLWRVAVPEIAPESALMWAAKSVASPKTEATAPKTEDVLELLPATTFVCPAQVSPKKTMAQTSKFLWVAAPQSAEKDSGLFDLDAGRTQFRTTEQPPAALLMQSARRSPELKPLDTLTSEALWTVADAATSEERNWIMSKSVVAVPSTATNKTLWSAPASFEEASDDSLFDPTVKRADFRTTFKAPAALERKSSTRKADNKALEPLVSTNLWTAAPQDQTERNWIASASASPVEGPKKARKTATPEQWEEALAQALAASYPRHRSVRAAATPEQWEEALAEAVAASYPRRHVRAARKAPIDATTADWASALAAAAEKSYPRPSIKSSPSFDATRRHPVFAEALSLTSKASITHPAAAGYIHDVTVTHPVFAASSLTTKIELFHPAATGYTMDVSTVHPVFFGSGIGEQVHPAMPSTSEPDASDAWLLAAKVEVAARDAAVAAAQAAAAADTSALQRKASTSRIQGSRISKMLSRFQTQQDEIAPSPSRSSSMSRNSRSITRESSIRNARSLSRGAPVELERGRKMEERKAVDVPSVPTIEPEVIAPVEKIGNAVQLVREPTVEPVVEPVAEPIVEPAVEPVVERIAEPVAEPIVERTAEPIAKPEPEVEVEFEVEPMSYDEPAAAAPEFFLPASTYQDPAILAQIQALEEERLFAQQWAAGASIEPVPTADETIFLPSTPPSYDEQESPVFSYNHMDEPQQQQQQQQEVIVPENASAFQFATSSPVSTRPGRILSIITSEPLFEAPTSPSTTYSAISRHNHNDEALAAATAAFKNPVVAQLRRADSTATATAQGRSVVSPLSEHGGYSFGESSSSGDGGNGFSAAAAAARDSLVSEVSVDRSGSVRSIKKKNGGGGGVQFLP